MNNIIILAKDARPGIYETEKGREIELRPNRSIKFFPRCTVQGGIPYMMKSQSGMWVYGYLRPDYKLIKKEE